MDLTDYVRDFRDDTNRRFAEVREDTASLKEKLDDIQKFKVEMIVSARWVSLVVSAVCGLITLVMSAWLSYKFQAIGTTTGKQGDVENVGFLNSVGVQFRSEHRNE